MYALVFCLIVTYPAYPNEQGIIRYDSKDAASEALCHVDADQLNYEAKQEGSDFKIECASGDKCQTKDR
jgi:hypothetical protein